MNELGPADESAFAPQDRVEEFVALLGRSKTHVHAQIVAMLANWNDADDVLQRTNIILWRKFGEWRPDQDFTLWACGIARLEAKNFLRVQSHDRLQFDAELVDTMSSTLAQVAAESSPGGPRLEALHQCLQKLRRQDRELVEGFYAGGSRSGPEIAQQFGRPLNTVYKALIRIRRALFECIERTLSAEGRS